MRQPDYWESQELQEQYEEWAKSHPDEVVNETRTPLAAAVSKARGDILTDADMKANIDFLNKKAAQIKSGVAEGEGE